MSANSTTERERERETETETAPICSPGVITRSLGLGWTRSFLEEPINFPNFLRLWMDPFPLVRLTGFYDPAPPPEHPAHSPNPIPEGRREEY